MSKIQVKVYQERQIDLTTTFSSYTGFDVLDENQRYRPLGMMFRHIVSPVVWAVDTPVWMPLSLHITRNIKSTLDRGESA